MEPEEGADDFLNQSENPIKAPHVQEFMASDRLLQARFHFDEASGKQDNGAAHSEGRWNVYLTRDVNRRPSPGVRLHFCHRRRERVESSRLAPVTAEPE